MLDARSSMLFSARSKAPHKKEMWRLPISGPEVAFPLTFKSALLAPARRPGGRREAGTSRPAPTLLLLLLLCGQIIAMCLASAQRSFLSALTERQARLPDN